MFRARLQAWALVIGVAALCIGAYVGAVEVVLWVTG